MFVLLSEQITDRNRDELLERLEAELAAGGEIERDTWGSSPAYVAQQRVIMENYGPPPGWSERVDKD